MDEIGIRELRDRLSATLARVRAGAVVTVMDRNTPVAVLVPICGSAADRLAALSAAGLVEWWGGKPSGLRAPPRVAGSSVADAVVEDRR